MFLKSLPLCVTAPKGHHLTPPCNSVTWVVTISQNKNWAEENSSSTQFFGLY